jgi:hypothetical protein
VLLGIGGRLALVPFCGLLVSIREAKNSGFTAYHRVNARELRVYFGRWRSLILNQQPGLFAGAACLTPELLQNIAVVETLAGCRTIARQNPWQTTTRKQDAQTNKVGPSEQQAASSILGSISR